MSEKILVTGGAGYIGAHTAAELHNNGFEPVIIDDLSRSDQTLLLGMEKITGKKPNFHQGNCLDRSFLQHVFEKYGPFSNVLHFAAFKSVGESVQKPLDYFRNNVGSLINLLEIMQENKCTNFIFSSSCTVYGQPDQIPVSEKAPFKPAQSPYGASKQMCERILEDAVATGFRVVSLRYFNPIGAHPSALLGELPIGPPNNLVPYITQTAAGVREKLTVHGNDYNTPDGSCIRDYIHVVDLARAHVQAMKYLSGQPTGSMFEPFNLGSGVGISVLQVIEVFAKVTGIKIPYVIGPRRPGDVEKVFADPAKGNKALQWKTEYTIEDSLLHAWQWEKKIRNL